MVIDNLVEIDNLSVEYMEISMNRKRPFRTKKFIKAMKEINFKLKQGENIAVLGRNGAGKSTLLKCIAGFLRPSQGRITTKGRIILLSGTNPGFQTDLTGRKNIEVLAPLYGINEKDIEEFIRDIEEFTELGEALNRNYKGYSTGMKGKLGFGFMTGLTPDILLIDETLGVGDLEFRAKAQIRLREFIKRSGSVLMSTHSLGLASEMCTRGILLDKGEIIFRGSAEACIHEYRGLISSK